MAEKEADYRVLVGHYENCFEKYGDSHKGVDWPNLEDANTRYKVMLELLNGHRDETEVVSVADIGCGIGHLLEYIRNRGRDNIEYIGHDLSYVFVERCREKFPGICFVDGDILGAEYPLPKVDFAVMNGVFTEKRELSFIDMFDFVKSMLSVIFANTRRGIAFNVMSKNVDWERDDLFHLSLDMLTDFLTRELSREFVIRNDYGLYEYTAYVYK